MSAVHTLAIIVATASLAVTDEPPKAVNTDTIKDKVSLKLDQEVSIRFEQDGDKRSGPAVVKPSADKASHITVQLGTTSASPFPPPR